MKYFFSLLLVGLIGFNIPISYGATEILDESANLPIQTPGVKSKDQPQETATPPDASSEAVETGKQNPATEGTETVLLPPPAKETAATPKTETAEAQSAQPTTAEERVPEGERAAEAEVADTQRPDAKPAEAQPITAEERTAEEPATRGTIKDLEGLLHPHRPERKEPLLTAEITQNGIMSLRETNIGRAIMEGKIEDYIAALKELTEVFNVPLKGTTIFDLMKLMIETTKNREFFAGEMFYLLVFHVLIDTSTTRSLSHIRPLLEKAKQVNNEMAFKLLYGLETLVTKYENSYSTLEASYRDTRTELTRQKDLKEQVIELVRNHYSKTNIALKAGFTALAGALTAWGYKLFTNASTDAVSFSYAPQISEFLSKVSDKDISIATMTIGAVLAAAGIQQCGKAFWRRRKVNNIRNQY